MSASITNSEKVLVPALRFKEFEGDWSASRLNDVAEFKKGKGISKADISEEGVLECIRYGELYTTYTELIQNIISKTNLPPKDLILSEFNDVIIPASGESNIDIATASCVLKSGVAYSGDLNVIRSKMDGIFLSFYLNNKRKFDIARLAQGVSVVHLYSSQLKTLKLNFPTLPEQQKIASFLSAVDDKVQQLTKKKELLEHYKKGVMQQLFSYEKRLHKGELRKGNLGDFGFFYYGKGAPKTSVVKGAPTPCVRYGELYSTFKEEIKEIKSYTIVDPKELKLSKGGEVLVPRVGEKPLEFANCSYLPFPNVAIGEMISVYNTEEDGLFMTYYINARLQKQLARMVEGANVSNLYFRYVAKIEVEIPCVEEQKLIIQFVSSIDTKIESVNTQITQTQSFKKGLLQQMFV